MIKSKEIRKMSLEDINLMLKDLNYEQIKASSIWGKNKVKKNKAGIKTSTKGDNTSIQKDLRRTKARLLTIKHEKENNQRN